MRLGEVERHSEATLRLQEVKNRLAVEDVEESNWQKVVREKQHISYQSRTLRTQQGRQESVTSQSARDSL